ncbi:MAG: hypothetical protein F9B45_18140 [Phycisphaera sp. RhM]|nr:hypothetical protein [Phycisphaera sp. RhM]
MSMWIKLNNKRSDDTNLSRQQLIEAGDKTPALQWFVERDGRLGFFVRPDSTVRHNAYTSATVDDGQWHHVAISLEVASSQLQMFIDGMPQPITMSGVTGTPQTLTYSPPLGIDGTNSTLNSYKSVYVGTHRAGFRTTQGKIDDVRIYSKALSPTEVAELKMLADQPAVADWSASPVDQTFAPGVVLTSTITVTPLGNSSWQALGSVVVDESGAVTFVQTGDADGNLAADALRLERAVLPSLSELDLTGNPLDNAAYEYVIPQLLTSRPGSDDPATSILDFGPLTAQQLSIDTNAAPRPEFDLPQRIAMDPSTATATIDLFSAPAVQTDSRIGMRFDGIDDGLIAGVLPDVSFANGFAIESWIYPTGPGDAPYGGMIINKEGQFELARFSDGEIHYAIVGYNGVDNWTWVNTGYNATQDQWTHLALTWDSTENRIRFFADGQLVHERGRQNLLQGDRFPDYDQLQIGSRQYPLQDQFFDGYLSDVRVWNRGLTQSEIGLHVRGESTPSTYADGLVGWWKMDEANVLDGVKDLSGNGYHAYAHWATATINTPTAVNLSFELEEPIREATYSVTGGWQHDYAAIVQSEGGISPDSGARMLRFLGTGVSSTQASSSVGSEIAQLIDLRAYPSVAGRTITFGAMFNRIAGDSETDTQFLSRIQAYQGDPDDFANATSLGITVADLFSDFDPSTWEYVEASMTLDANTDFVRVWLVAVENIFNDTTGVEFDGHYADSVQWSIDGDPNVGIVSRTPHARPAVSSTLTSAHPVFDPNGDDYLTTLSSDHPRLSGNVDSGTATILIQQPFEGSESITLEIADVQPAYRDQVLSHQPVAYYRLDESAVGQIKDSSGYGNDATASGNLTPGVNGALLGNSNSAFEFTGGQVVAEVPQLDTADGASNSVSLWMKWDGSEINGRPMVFGFADGYDLILRDGFFGFNTNNGDVYGAESSGFADRWVHVGAVFVNGDADQNQLFIDGKRQQLTRLNGVGPRTQSATKLAFISGWGLNANYRFPGKIDEVALFDRALTEHEFASQASAQIHHPTGRSWSTRLDVIQSYDAISGTHFEDLSGDGIQQVRGMDGVIGTSDDELPVEGATVYLDANRNGQWDASQSVEFFPRGTTAAEVDLSDRFPGIQVSAGGGYGAITSISGNANSVIGQSRAVHTPHHTYVEPSTGDGFGQSIVMVDNWMFVGDPSANSNAGEVVVYELSSGGWSEVDRIQAVGAAAEDRFGTSLAIDWDTLVVGAPGDDGAGSAYLFEYDSFNTFEWVEVDRLTGSTRAAGDEFGFSVDSSSDHILIGAPGASASSGAAYLFDVLTRTEISTLTPSAVETGEEIGFSVTLGYGNETRAVVGAPGGVDGGSFVSFSPDGEGNWIETNRVTSDTTLPGDRFGHALAMDDNGGLLVGAPSANSYEPFSTFLIQELTGAVYVFFDDGSDWYVDGVLYGDAEKEDAKFGTSLSLDDDYAVIGAPGDASTGVSGAAYVFRSGYGWYDATLETTLRSSVGDGTTFGAAVAIDGSSLAVSSTLEDVSGSDRATTQIFDLQSQWQIESNPLQIDLAIPAYSVTVEVAAVGVPGDIRVDAYDLAGNMVTSETVAAAVDAFGLPSELVTLTTPTASISRLLVGGVGRAQAVLEIHASLGSEPMTLTDVSGEYRFATAGDQLHPVRLLETIEAVESTTRKYERINHGYTQQDTTGSNPSVSANGRFVAYQSYSSRIVAGDSGFTADIFVFDRYQGTTERLTIGFDGSQPNGSSFAPSISGDGRYVTFESRSTNLVSAPSSGNADVFVADRESGTISRVTNGIAGTGGDGFSNDPMISGDGKFVIFSSTSSNLIAGDTNAERDVFRYEMATGTVIRLSEDGLGMGGDDGSFRPAISHDGSRVVFLTAADNLVGADTPEFELMFAEIAENSMSLSVLGKGTANPAISGDGSTVAMWSFEEPDGAPYSGSNVFVYDVDSGVWTRVLNNGIGAGVNSISFSWRPTLSFDGTRLAFATDHADFFHGVSGTSTQVYVYERDTQTVRLITPSTADNGESTETRDPFISANGEYVAFVSSAVSFVPDLTDGVNNGDVFLTALEVDDASTGQIRVVDSGSTILVAEGTSVDLVGQLIDPNRLDGTDWTAVWSVFDDQGTLVYSANAILSEFTVAGEIQSIAELAGNWMARDAGRYEVRLSANDNDSGDAYEHTHSLVVRPVAPTADAGGPYVISEGDLLVLDASQSMDAAAGDNLTYQWTIDGQAFTDSNQMVAIVSWSEIRALLGARADGPSLSPIPIGLRVTDPDDGDESFVLTTLHINNAGPAITLSPPTNITAGKSLTLVASAADEAYDGDNPLSYRLLIEGNVSQVGTSSTIDLEIPWTSLGVVYQADQSNAIQLTVEFTDSDGSVSSETTQIYVVNAVPDAVPDVAMTLTAGEGLLLDATQSNDADGHSLRYYWNVITSTDDVSTAADFIGTAVPSPLRYDETGVASALSWNSLLALFTGTVPDAFDIQLFVMDEFGDVDVATTAVSVANAIPSAKLPHPIEAFETDTVRFEFSQLSDPNPADLAGLTFDLAIDLNRNGDFTDPGESIAAVPGNPSSFAYTFPDDGAYAIRATVTDPGGLFQQTNSVIEIINAAPLGELAVTVAGSILEGSSFGVDFLNIVDSAADLAAGIVAEYDVNGDGQYGDDPTSITFPGDGIYVVRGRLIDQDGATFDDSISVVVSNAAPTIDSLATPASTTEGDLLTITGSFSDSGANDPWVANAALRTTAGQVELLTIPLEINRQTRQFTGSYLVTQEVVGGIDVQVTLSDGVDSVASQTQTVALNNVAPNVVAGADVLEFNEHRLFRREATFTDPGNDAWSVTVDYGDGSPVENPIAELNPDDGVGYVPLEHVYQTPGSYTVTVSVDDGTDIGSDAFAITIGDNQAPFVAQAIDDLTVRPGVAIRSGYVNLHQVFSDSDNPDSELTFSLQSNSAPTIVTAVEISADGNLDLTFASDQAGSSNIRIRATDPAGDSIEEEFTVHLLAPSFRVTDVTPNVSGFDVYVNRDLDISALNLFDGSDPSGDQPDLLLLGQNSGPVQGSLIWHATERRLSFVRTGGPLEPDNYTLTLFGRSDGFVDLSAQALDGDDDQTPGGIYTFDFTAESAVQARTVSIPDFARAPGQPIETPVGHADGLPIAIDDANGVRSVDLNLRFDPARLQIDSVAKAAGLPSDWTVTFNPIEPGRLRLTASGATSLSAGAQNIYAIDATVKATAGYGVRSNILIENLSINEDELPAIADQQIFQTSLLGDVTGDQTYSGLDASYISRRVVGLDSGFDAYPLTDPLLLADVTGNGSLSGLDASDVSRKVVGLDDSDIPEIPASQSGIAQSGPTIDLQLSSTTAAAGSQVEVSVSASSVSEGVSSLDLRIHFDAQKMSLADGQILLGAATNHWSLNYRIDNANGFVDVSMFAESSLAGTELELLKLRFDVASDAFGNAQVTLDTTSKTPQDVLWSRMNEGRLVIASTAGLVTIYPTDTRVLNVVINEGQASRSQVTSLTIRFNTLIDHLAAQNAFQIRNLDKDLDVGVLNVLAEDVNGITVIRLTFAGTSTTSRSGEGDRGNSLADGNYRLIIDADAILPVGSPAMPQDYIFGDRTVDDFFRIFGDTDADRDVDGQDYGRFGLTFLKSIDDSGYRADLDSDGDGDVDGQDYGRFGLNFLRSI